MANLVKTFTGLEDFQAMNAAEAFLTRAGFSFGRTQRGNPRGILWGDYDIQKWRNLNHQERADCHGQMTGDMREGPVLVTIFEHAPHEAKRAFHQIALLDAGIR